MERFNLVKSEDFWLIACVLAVAENDNLSMTEKIKLIQATSFEPAELKQKLQHAIQNQKYLS